MERTTRRVGIVGYADGFNNAPWDDETIELWGENRLYEYLEPSQVDSFARWFEIHDREILEWRSPPHMEWLGKNHPFPIYMQSGHRDLPNSTPYPITPIQLLVSHGSYLAGTFAYMIALAIHLGFPVIELWGVNSMREQSEPREAGRNAEFWLGVAEGRGAEVVVHEPSDLLRTWWQGRYGFDGQPPEWYMDRRNEVDVLTPDGLERFRWLIRKQAEDMARAAR